MEKNSTKRSALSIICGALTAFGIVASIVSLVKDSSGTWTAYDVANLLVTALIAWYAATGYRKPHGNLLKWIILIFTVSFLHAVYDTAGHGMAVAAVREAIIAGLLCYVAGRLHRVKQNLYFMIIVTALIVAGFVMGYVDGVNTIGALTKLIVWLDICVAYFLRYKEHKEAGLMDNGKE